MLALFDWSSYEPVKPTFTGAKVLDNIDLKVLAKYIDVSTLKELAARWAPDVRDSFKKGSTHLALDDIRESIADQHHYRQH